MIDYSDSELNSRIEGMLASDCQPAYLFPEDSIKTIGKSKEEIEELHLHRYYASELIGIKAGETPPFNVLDKNKDDMTEDEKVLFGDFAMKIARLISADDICDVKGIVFITKFLAHYNSSHEQIGHLNPHAKGYVSGVALLQNKIVTFAKAAIKVGS